MEVHAMKRSIINRIVSLTLALAVLLMFPAVFSQEAQAASGNTKTVYVLTSSKTVSTDPNGKKETTTIKRTYDKNGLWSGMENSQYKTVVSRNKKGYFNKIKTYDLKGKLIRTNTYKMTYNKKGLVTTEKMYTQEAGKKKKLTSTYKYTYYGNNNFKTAVGKYDDQTFTEKYNKKGILSSSVTESRGEYPRTSTTTYDKYGNIKKYVYEGTDYKTTDVHTTLKYDKYGNLVKDIYTSTSQYIAAEGQDSMEPIVTKYTKTIKYKYDSHKNIIKEVTTVKAVPSVGDPFTTTTTKTMKYKAVKIEKKYWHIAI